MREAPICDWGLGNAPAPSLKRIRPLDWLRASASLGAASSLAALWLSWRELPGCPAPVGSLVEHALRVGMLAVHRAFGWAFAERSAAYVDFLSALDGPQRAAIMGRVAFALLAGLIPAAFLFGRFMLPRDGLIHLRGPRRREGKEAAKLLKASLAKRVARRPGHEIAPGLAYPADLWCGHVVVVGSPGSGKSTFLKPLLVQVFAAGERLLAFDVKGDLTAMFPGAAIIAPWDARSLFWDIARDLRNKGDIRRFAARMIPEGQDPMWSAAARQVLVGFLMMLKRERGNDWGWRDLADLMAIPMAELLPIMREHNKEAVRAVERASVTTAGIMINLAAFCSPIFDLADAWEGLPPERGISFVEWAKGKNPHRQVILQGHGSYEDLAKGCVEAIVGVVAGLIASVEMDDDPDRVLWFVCDEFAQMGAVPFRQLLELGRGRGLRCVLACQDLAQLEEIHGAGTVRALVSMCSTLVVGRVSPGDTADAMAKSLGSREVERANVSTSRGAGGERSSSLSYAREEIALYRASELSSRLGLSADGKSVRMIVSTGGQAYEIDFPIRPEAKRRPAHVPAKWTLGVDMAPRDAGSAASGGRADASGADRPMAGVALPIPKGPKAAAAGSGPEAGGGMLRWLESSGALVGVGDAKGSAAGKSAAQAKDAAVAAAKPSGFGYVEAGNVSSIGDARSKKPPPKLDGQFRLDRLPAPADIERLARESIGPRARRESPVVPLFPNAGVEFKATKGAKPASGEAVSESTASMELAWLFGEKNPAEESAGAGGREERPLGDLGAGAGRVGDEPPAKAEPATPAVPMPGKRVAEEMARARKRSGPGGAAGERPTDAGRARRRAMATFATLVFRSVDPRWVGRKGA